MNRLRDVDLSRLNSFGVAARAREVLVYGSREDTAPMLDALAGATSPALVLGGGSNVVFAGDPAGPVVLVRSRGRRVVEDAGDRVVVEVEAGEDWDSTVRWSIAQGFYGLENLVSIPGSVGAAPWQNIGAYGLEIAERIATVDAIDLVGGHARRFTRAECGFGYRDSVFKRGEGAHWLIRSVALALSRRPAVRIDYGDLRAELGAAAGTPEAAPGPAAVADAVAAIRRRKLPDPARLGNAGSFFKNPVLDADRADRLRAEHPGLPLYPVADPALRKASAAWLIESCGWKGAREGAIGVSAQHALVLVNHGGGTGREVIALARRIQESVLERFGVRLEPEPTIVG
ncbi:MAG: UDP-N-acetylmuramate dehydrogenase [Lautropia sp.]